MTTTLNAVSAKLDTPTLTDLVKQVDVDKKDAKVVAKGGSRRSASVEAGPAAHSGCPPRAPRPLAGALGGRGWRPRGKLAGTGRGVSAGRGGGGVRKV
ncbi:MAG: hypothetical protein IPM08_00940 [Actinomycetales bacterium]|nr:hypothetical protein [Actinomycetales bacterium]